MKSKTLLFDLDGTLIDSTPAILNSFHFAFEKLNLKPSLDEDIKSLIGLPLDEAFIKLYQDKAYLVNDFVDFYREKYRTIYLDQTTLLPLAKEALELANEFADLAVVTTKGSQFTKPLLDFLGVGHFFKSIVGRNDVQFAKPHPEPILTALDRLNKDKTHAFMIGDTQFDILAAKAAGISHIALSCGYESIESLQKYSDCIKNNAYEAVKHIAKL
ncbi:HAD family hydrolase [Campylobacter vulpis]|uniref:Hydrolase n=1 Tax=Campylobacter vulpis TaxID=1655500 RepID=A0A2G4QZP7_9BACT|nr:HAD family hydrolase [Campylobacter vulpis]MBS4240823.1 HAD family hydrolase [Campylobacter vulpis]MBS4252364.1 HAD family hydrolase [Campylobacter vulpis]MBS4275358.1 HAD family hydrolase [Campylobacter vulpis]MBS4281595.1 HAD family hydrolase [Campylobacter vulpis]MBS4306545.1 HAD family hydrolase [Campylobacter vulpis]